MMTISSSANTQIPNTIAQNKSETDAVLSKIGATKELNGTNGANLVVSDSLASQIASLSQGIQNSNEIIGIYQITDASVQSIQAGADKLSDLSIRFNNAALGTQDKESLQKQFDDISTSMQDIVAQTTYNGQNLLSGNSNISGLSDLTINDQEGISNFRENLSSLSSSISSQLSSTTSSITNSLNTMTSLSSANSQISETPLDQKIDSLKSDEIKLTSSVLAQVHQNSMMQQSVSALLS